jgi:Pyruvate/2-oxoacid:ferredoxin oxidoreductase delta subunit
MLRITGTCVGCGHCKAFCPAGAIDTCGVSVITDKCTGCGICKGYCAIGAIEEEA